MIAKPLKFADPCLQGMIHLPKNDKSALSPGVVFVADTNQHRQGPGGLFRQLAQKLCSAGYPALQLHRRPGSDKEISSADTISAIDQLQKLSRHNRMVVVAHRNATRVAIDTALADRRVVGLYLFDDNAFRTPGFYLHHWLLFNPRRWLSRLCGQSRSTHKAPTYALSQSAKHQQRYRIWRLIQRGVRVHLAYTGGQPSSYNHEDQWKSMYGDLTPSECLDASWLPRCDSAMSLPEQRDIATRQMLFWMSQNLYPPERSNYRQAA